MNRPVQPMGLIPRRFTKAKSPQFNNTKGGKYYPTTRAVPRVFSPAPNYARAQPGRIQPPGNTGGIRIVIRHSMLEATAPIGTIYPQSTAYNIDAKYKVFSRYQIIRVGIEVNPASYIEFVIRMSPLPPTSIDTRGELVRQQDCVKYRNLQAGPKTFWFRPETPRSKGWQNPLDQTVFEPDMYLFWNGINQILEGANGIVGSVVLDIKFDGLIL